MYNDMIVSGTSHIRFGIDASGNYGYKKVGADTVTPFKSGSDISILYRVNYVANQNSVSSTNQTVVATATYTVTKDNSIMLLASASEFSSNHNTTVKINNQSVTVDFISIVYGLYSIKSAIIFCNIGDIVSLTQYVASGPVNGGNTAFAIISEYSFK